MNVLDTAALIASATLPFAVMILVTRWQNSPRRQNARRWSNIMRVSNELDKDIELAGSRERHPAGKYFQPMHGSE